jgi:ion channel
LSWWLVQLAGIALILLSVSDVFMTVLYVRAGTGPMSHRLARRAWGLARWLAHALPQRSKDTFLTFFGPAFLVALTTVWVGLAIVGFSLITWPYLGKGVTSQIGPTPTDFLTAFYFAGGSMSTMGGGDLRAVSPAFKCLAVMMSVLGVSLVTLIVTYIIQVYTALQHRNALALGLHHACGGTGDAATLLARLGAADDFAVASSELSSLATQITSNYESHHFYSVLIYFRFREPQYALGRTALIVLELVSLIDSGLNEERHGWFERSASVTQVREGGMHVLTELAGTYLPGGPPAVGEQDETVTRKWRERYHAALDYLSRCGVSVTPDPQRGAERYVELRRQWDSYVMALAHYLENTPEQVDPVGTHPQSTGELREMPVPPLKAAG